MIYTTYPLKSITIEEAIKMQFHLVDEITKVFRGREMLTRGDLGLATTYNKPHTTNKVEEIIANYFGTESALLVRGSGTGAIFHALFSVFRHNHKIVVHDAPIYPTTKTSLKMLHMKPLKTDFNDLENLEKYLKSNIDILNGALVQHTRQKINDKYDISDVLSVIGKFSIPIITDENYAVFKVKKIGVQLGADISCFSCFKILGPEGIGCIIGKEKYIKKIIKLQYSGGMQVQGHEAMDVLRGMIYAPVMFAIQAKVTDECLKRLNSHEVIGVKNAFIANAQSKVLIVELTENNALKVIKEAEKLGAAPFPIGAESRYEHVPMFYRVSGTFKESDPSLVNRMIRINPMRAGSDTIIRILTKAIQNVKKKKIQKFMP